MATQQSPVHASRSLLPDIAVGVILVASLAFTVFMLQRSQGADSWLLDVACGSLVGVAALARRVDRTAMAVSGHVTALGAVGFAGWADLPQEPGPATALALSVLSASVLTHESARRAAGVVMLALLVQVVAWVVAAGEHDVLTAVTVYNVVFTAGGVATGLFRRARRDRLDPRITSGA